MYGQQLEITFVAMVMSKRNKESSDWLRVLAGAVREVFDAAKPGHGWPARAEAASREVQLVMADSLSCDEKEGGCENTVYAAIKVTWLRGGTCQSCLSGNQARNNPEGGLIATLRCQRDSRA